MFAINPANTLDGAHSFECAAEPKQAECNNSLSASSPLSQREPVSRILATIFLSSACDRLEHKQNICHPGDFRRLRGAAPRLTASRGSTPRARRRCLDPGCKTTRATNPRVASVATERTARPRYSSRTARFTLDPTIIICSLDGAKGLQTAVARS